MGFKGAFMKHGLTTTRDSISAGLRGIGVMHLERVRRGPHAVKAARGFTLIEITVVVVIITILSALTLVGVGGAIRSARRASEIELLRNLSRGVESFQQQFGFPPPLVDDKNPMGPIETVGTKKRIRIAGEVDGNDAATTRYLRYQDPDPTKNTVDSVVDPANFGKSYRYSELSIPYYILGVLDKTIDGIDGPGFTKPQAEGQFSKVGGKIGPLFDVSNISERLANSSTDPTQTRLLDRWKLPIRYFRWDPLLHVAGSVDPRVGKRFKQWDNVPLANNPKQAGEVRDYNCPPIFGDPRDNSSLRNAKWALVSHGPDGQIDYNEPFGAENADNIMIMDGGTLIDGIKQ